TARRERELADQYERSLASERAAAQAQIQNALQSAEEHRKAMELAYQEKQKALQIQVADQEKLLAVRWQEKEAAALRELTQHYKQKETSLQEDAQRQLEQEITRLSHELQDR